MWWGKVVGAALGLYRGGPAGMVLGLLVGHMVDRALAQWLAKLRFGTQQRAPRSPAKQRALLQAYEHLGVPADASDAEIKRAYQRAMSQYHPDRLRARGQPESARQESTRKVQQLQAAFELIRKARKA